MFKIDKMLKHTITSKIMTGVHATVVTFFPTIKLDNTNTNRLPFVLQDDNFLQF